MKGYEHDERTHLERNEPMSSLAYHLGRIASRYVRRVKWIAAELVGTEAERIRTEEELGRELAASFDPAVEADSDCQELLAALGGRLSSHVGKPRRRFRFHLLREKANNAWALPGGYVFLTQTLVEFCSRDEHELAFVLAHEMGHIVLWHAIERYKTGALLRGLWGTQLTTNPLTVTMATLAASFLEQSYSQDQELEADEFGFELARRAGFTPAASIRFLERLAGLTEEESALESYFSTHPSGKLRVAAVRRLGFW